MENTAILVQKLLLEPAETEWLELKHNQADPHEIGKAISALANSATYCERKQSYMVWGVDDVSHKVIGTIFNPKTQKIGNEELINWLDRMLNGLASYLFEQVSIDDKPVVVLTIDQAVRTTVKFMNIEYIRVGSYTKKLKDHPALEMRLWNRLSNTEIENRFVRTDLRLEDVIQLLDYAVYFRLMHLRIPVGIDQVVHYLVEESLIVTQDNGLYAITTMGALLFAKNLREFNNLSRKRVRLVLYKDTTKRVILKEPEFDSGYAAGFEELYELVTAMVKGEEVFERGIRTRTTAIPPSTIRELIANALIHQDLLQTGVGPIIEIFTNRIEVTNPGRSLVDVSRIVDNPPKSRNEKVASLMRRLGLCEELGSGWDRIILDSEAYRLPAPKIIEYEESVRVIAYAATSFSNLSLDDKVRACYLHATIMQMSDGYLTNTSLRNRFGLTSSASPVVSRLIREALKRNLIKPLDPSTAPRYMKYVPYWA